MNGFLRVVLCLLLPLLAVDCASETAGSRPGTNSASAAICRAENFAAFLQRFASDSDFQKQVTASPLQKLVVDGSALPEPKPVEKTIELAPANFPIYPSARRIEEDSLQIQVKPGERGMTVSVSKADTDYLVVYLFEHRECWTLVRIEDWSL